MISTTIWLVLFMVFSNTINLVVSSQEAEIAIDRVTTFPMMQPIISTHQVSPKRMTQGRGMGSISYTGTIELPPTIPRPRSFSQTSSSSTMNIPRSFLHENLTDVVSSSRFDVNEPSSSSYDEPCPSSSPSPCESTMQRQTNTVRAALVGDTMIA